MKRILVALDSSQRAPSVLAAAIELTRALGGTMRLARAIPIQPEVPWDMIRQFPPGGLEELMSEHARTELEQQARAVPPELLDGVVAVIGVPWRAIEEAARAFDADVIVVGSHGYSFVERMLGTTAASVVRHAERSVLVVRDHGPTGSALG